MNKTSRLAVILLLIACAFFAVPQTAISQDASSPTAVFVFVPYDKVTGPQLGPGQSVLLPYAEFLRLKSAAAVKPETPEFRPMASIAQSVFKGVVEGSVAKLEAEFTIETLARPKDALEIQLPFAGASIESATIEDPKASVGPLREGTGLRLFLRGEGRRVLRLRLAVPLQSAEAGKRLDFSIPRAAASSLSLRVAEEVALESIPEALPATIAAVQGGGVEIHASCGSRDRVLIAYRPRAKVTGEAARTRITINEDYRVSLSSRAANARVKVDVQVLAGNAEAVVVQIPQAARLLSVSGSFVRDWSAADKQGNVTVTLVRPISQPFDFTLDLQLETSDVPTTKPAAGPDKAGEKPTRLVIPEIRVPGASREAGTITIQPEAGLSVWPDETAGLEAVSVSAPTAATRGFRFAQPGWRLTLWRRAIPARVRADGLILYEVTDEFVRLKSRHRLTISGRGVFDVAFSIPENFELREAGPPELVSGFRQEGRRVAIVFREEQRATCEVSLSCQRARTPSDPLVRIEPVEVAGAEEDAGSVVLAMPLALRATERESSGLEATDVRGLQERLQPLMAGDLSAVMGYRYFTPRFLAVASIERQRTRVTCETARLVSIMPSLMRVDTTLNYNVEFSATGEFRLLLPASAGEDVRFSGSDIKEKVRSAPAAPDTSSTDTLTTWTVRLQRRVLGPYTLSVSFEVPLPEAKPGEARQVIVPVVRATDVARETGFVAISRGENLEVRMAKAEGLEPRDVKELPANLAGASLGFRYFEPEGQRLELELIRHELAGVLGAVIRRMHIDTVLSDQREAVHEVFFEVQNNRQQYLEIKLPAGMEMWSAFVRGGAVRPTIRQSDGARLIELTKSETQDQAFRVRMVLRQTLAGGAMGRRGRLPFAAPEPINMPVLRTTWKLYLPRGYRYIWFGGTMKQETGGHLPWVEPAAEALLNDIPARVAGGIAQPTLHPPQAQVPVSYESGETEAEKRARLQAEALEIPVVREGLQFEFSKLSGIGSIETHYWKRKPLLLFQGVVAIVVLLAVVGLMAASGRLWPAVAVALVTFAVASLTEGLAGRLSATAFAASGTAFALGLLVYAIVRLRSVGVLAARGSDAGPPPSAAAGKTDQPATKVNSGSPETPPTE